MPDERQRPRRHVIAVVVMLAAASVAVISPHAGAASSDPLIVEVPAADGDIIPPIPHVAEDGPPLLVAAASDPLGLVAHPDEVRRYSLGRDVFEVWECPDAGPVPISASDFSAEAETRMTAYFGWVSGGRYDPDFVVGGVVPAGESCAGWARTHATGSAHAALFIRNTTGGLAGPGLYCSPPGSDCFTPTYPTNRREGYVGVAAQAGSISWTTLAHEMGHMLSWPHSYTRTSSSEYDNAIDLMSGNYSLWTSNGTTYRGSYPYPYATIAYNRYAAGWIDPSDIVVWDGTDRDITLRRVGDGGTQALVVDVGDVFFVLGARIASAQDPFRPEWSGVEVYEVDRCGSCWSLNGDIRPKPPVPFAWADIAAYTQPLDHVLQVGESIELGGATITVSSSSASTFTISVDGEGTDPPPTEPPPDEPPPPPDEPPAPTATSRFRDVPTDHLFFQEIEWLAQLGITAGCNPPTNDLFCPDDRVTRGQFAAFMQRAFGWTDDGGGDLFLDDDTSVFERDIDILATAGVTRGCNPPGNDRFCPEGEVTRGQFAAFFTRAFGYTDDGGGDLFVDDDGSVFERDIDRLATAGVTSGCNPPANDEFCPEDFLTRAQLAAFFYRAFP